MNQTRPLVSKLVVRKVLPPQRSIGVVQKTRMQAMGQLQFHHTLLPYEQASKIFLKKYSTVETYHKTLRDAPEPAFKALIGPSLTPQI